MELEVKLVYPIPYSKKSSASNKFEKKIIEQLHKCKHNIVYAAGSKSESIQMSTLL